MNYRKKLIEVALPLAAISDAASKEKTLKNSHPANLHLWWARRPLAAARAVLWASLVDDPSSRPDEFPNEDAQRRERNRLFDLMERLIQWEASNDKGVIAEARVEIEKSLEGGEWPSVLDPFGGGGAIPLEALRLGLKTSSGDLNPVAVLIQRSMLQVIPRFAGRRPVNPQSATTLGSWEQPRGLSLDLEYYGARARSLAWEEVGDHYPPSHPEGANPSTAIAWIWARTVKSPDPSWPHHVPLVKSWTLAKRPGKLVTHISPVVMADLGEIRYEIKHGGTVADPTVSRASGVCIVTGTPIPSDYIKSEGIAGRIGHALLAVVGEGKNQRVYSSPTPEQIRAAEVGPPKWKPVGVMSDHPQYMGTPRYGLDEWWKLFTSRQLSTMTAFVDALPVVHAEARADALEAGFVDDDRSFADGGSGALAYADALVLFLMFAIDKLADLNNSLAAWEPIAQCPRHLFGRQAIQMTWDFAEANPFSSSSGSFSTIVTGISRTLTGPGLTLPVGKEADIEQRDAASRVRSCGPVVVATDPPYYDNVPYSDLSDFFYVWMRRGLGPIFPSDTATLLTPKAEELVADQKRFGSRQAAHEHFESGMGDVFEEVAKSQDPRYPASVFYAFKAVEDVESGRVSTGWSSFLGSLMSAGLSITATWPIRTENRSRLRGMNSNALASSVVLACRPRRVDAPMATRGEFVGRLRSEMLPAVRVLQEQNIAPVDLAQSAIGPGISIFSSYARVVEADGATMTVMTALGLINESLSEILNGEESEFDSDTRFALTWYEQFGHNPGPFGDADMLAKAKDTTVAGVCEAGVAASRDGKFRLVERAELPEDWDPATDARLTVWETTQYLIRAIESSESEAAVLLARLGEGVGERARQLAYLLYGICDRKKWAEEAGAYNMLVTAWPELTKLVAGGPTILVTGTDALF